MAKKKAASVPSDEPSRVPNFLADPPPGFKGITGLYYAKAGELHANPNNWRKHPKRQLEHLQVSIRENGWAGACLFNTRTNRLIDGHGRIKLDPNQIVPVLVGDFTPEQEHRILQTLDPLSAMAETDATALDALNKLVQGDLERCQTEIDETSAQSIAAITHDLSTLANQISAGEYSPELFPQEELNPHAAENQTPERQELIKRERIVASLEAYPTYPDSNDLGCPNLLTKHLSTVVPTDVWAYGKDIVSNETMAFVYGSNRIGGPNNPPECKGGVLLFYTEDDRFESCWNAVPEFTARLLGQGWGGVVTPDFSTYWNWPWIHRLYNIYRQRYVGRYWQEAGIPIIPGLVTVGDITKTEFEIMGIPKKCPVIAFECRAGFSPGEEGDKQRAIWMESINRQIKELKPENVVVYGGEQHRDWLKLYKGPNYVYLSQWATVRSQHGGFGKTKKE